MISIYDKFSIETFSKIDKLKDKEYNLFISAYNNEEMVKVIYNNINADRKIWCILIDYKLDEALEIKDNEKFQSKVSDIESDTLESDYINKFLEDCSIVEYKDKNICIDITGFVKPYFIYLIYALKEYGFNNIDIIYSEPKYWENLDETVFSKETIIKTRPINGFDIRVENGENDLQIIAAGYDHKLIRACASYSSKLVKRKQILIGFPSLQPSMYQENILNFQKSADELNIDYDNFNPIFAPANDPFETAKVLKEYVDQYIEDNDDVDAIYLFPLSTKPHALGMLLFFLYERDFYKRKNIEIIMLYPFTKSYSSSAGKQLAKINLYTLEF